VKIASKIARRNRLDREVIEKAATMNADLERPFKSSFDAGVTKLAPTPEEIKGSLVTAQPLICHPPFAI